MRKSTERRTILQSDGKRLILKSSGMQSQAIPDEIFDDASIKILPSNHYYIQATGSSEGTTSTPSQSQLESIRVSGRRKPLPSFRIGTVMVHSNLTSSLKYTWGSATSCQRLLNNTPSFRVTYVINPTYYRSDRGGFAVVTINEGEFNIPLAILPEDIQEGGRIGIDYHPPDTEKLSQANNRLERLKKRDSGQQSIDL